MNKTLLSIVAASIFCIGLIGAGVYFAVKDGGTTPQANTVRISSDGLSGLLTGTAPWPANTNQLGERLAAIGFSQLSAEGSALHIHQHLDIVIDGKQVPVPADIGIGQGFISNIHVHDNTGIIHVESPTIEDFYLGQFFDVWGVKLSATAIGGYVATGDKQLQVYSNGTKVTSNPRLLKLAEHQEIVIVYGTPAEMPTSIPSSYSFPANY